MELNNDCLFVVFSYFDLNEFLNLCLLNKEFNNLTIKGQNAQSLWRQNFVKEFGQESFPDFENKD
jgi:hypothetical protein